MEGCINTNPRRGASASPVIVAASAFVVAWLALCAGPAGAQSAERIQGVARLSVAPEVTPQEMADLAAGRAPSGKGSAPSAPAPERMPSPRLKNSLVEEALDRAAPLTREEMMEFRRELLSRQAGAWENASGKPPAKAVTSVHTLDLSPGSTPPVVRVEHGQGAVVSFLDSAGNPWPIEVADNFNKGLLRTTLFGGHQLSISANTPGAVFNVGVSVLLQGLPTAISFNVVSGQGMVDAQAHMVVPRYLPGQEPPAVAVRGEPSLAAGDLMAFLLRTPPKVARSLQVEGLSGALAWQMADQQRMVLRTTALVTTGWFRRQGLGDGTMVYEMPLSPVIRVVDGGQFRTVRIAGYVVGGHARGDKQ